LVNRKSSRSGRRSRPGQQCVTSVDPVADAGTSPIPSLCHKPSRSETPRRIHPTSGGRWPGRASPLARSGHSRTFGTDASRPATGRENVAGRNAQDGEKWGYPSAQIVRRAASSESQDPVRISPGRTHTRHGPPAGERSGPRPGTSVCGAAPASPIVETDTTTANTQVATPLCGGKEASVVREGPIRPTAHHIWGPRRHRGHCNRVTRQVVQANTTPERGVVPSPCS
jgi:hypothetical protein